MPSSPTGTLDTEAVKATPSRTAAFDARGKATVSLTLAFLTKSAANDRREIERGIRHFRSILAG